MTITNSCTPRCWRLGMGSDMTKYRLDIPASLMMTFEGENEEAAIAAAKEWCGLHEGFDIDQGDENQESRLYPMPSGTDAEEIEVSDIYEEGDTDEAE